MSFDVVVGNKLIALVKHHQIIGYITFRGYILVNPLSMNEGFEKAYYQYLEVPRQKNNFNYPV